MRRAFGRFLMWIGGLTLFMTVLVVVIVLVAARGKKAVPGRVLLELDLEKGVVENVPDNPLAKLTGERTSLHDVTFALERAENDPRVIGLVARIGGGTAKNAMGIAQAQELRDAITRFRQKGKFALAFSETFGARVPSVSRSMTSTTSTTTRLTYRMAITRIITWPTSASHVSGASWWLTIVAAPT